MTDQCITTTRAQQVVTLPNDIDLVLRLALLDAIEEALRRQGVERMWIDPRSTQLVVVAELPSA